MARVLVKKSVGNYFRNYETPIMRMTAPSCSEAWLRTSDYRLRFVRPGIIVS